MTAALTKRILYYIATVTSVAIVFLATGFQQDAVILFSTVLLMNISLETTLLQRSSMICATGLLAGFFLWIGVALTPYALAQMFFIAAVTATCAHAGTLNGRYAYPLFVVNFLTILSLQSTSSDNALQSVLVGVLITLTTQIILLPFYSRDEYRRSIKLTLHRLSRLSTNIFTCLLSPDYPDNIYLFERRVHKQKIKCLNQMLVLGKREQAATHAHTQSDEMQALLEILLDMGQIRRRVTDFSTFALCANELGGLSADIENMFAAMAAKRLEVLELTLASMQRSIHNFEDTLEHVLKVAAPDPLVFVLFAGSLKALLKQCREMAGVK